MCNQSEYALLFPSLVKVQFLSLFSVNSHQSLEKLDHRVSETGTCLPDVLSRVQVCTLYLHCMCVWLQCSWHKWKQFISVLLWFLTFTVKRQKIFRKVMSNQCVCACACMCVYLCRSLCMRWKWLNSPAAVEAELMCVTSCLSWCLRDVPRQVQRASAPSSACSTLWTRGTG